MINPREIFPYETIREGQLELIEITRDIAFKGGHAVIEGCNGLGKTIGLLTGVLSTVLNSDHPVVYLARTHKQIDRVMSELKLIAKKREVKGISLRGRVEMCFNQFVRKYCSDPNSAMNVCKELQKLGKCSYYNNLVERARLFERLEDFALSNPLTNEELMNICRRQEICPYEFVKKIMPEATVIAANYMYLFHPNIRELFLTHLKRKLSELIVILDEAHNLPEIALNIASDAISKNSIKSAISEAEKYRLNEIKAFCKRFLKIYEEIEPLIGGEEEILVPKYTVEEGLQRGGEYSDLIGFLEDMHEKGEMIQRLMISEGKLPHSYIHRLAEFTIYWMDTAGKREYCHVVRKYLTGEGGSYTRIEIVALDPRKITRNIYSQCYASISVSGTIQPTQAFVDITGLSSSTVQAVLKSPFKKENVLALIVEGVSTALTQRVESNYNKIIDKISEVVEATPANIGVFVPSYTVLKDLLNYGLEDRLNKKLFVEKIDATSKENDKMIKNFKKHKDLGGGVLLGVMGGRNSEGEDFPGDEMNSSIVVGVPYAKPTPSVKASIRYFEEQFPGKGREYGYIIPSMRRAVQAGGRVIRRLSDRGAIVFLDWRFTRENCLKYFPNWLREHIEIIPDKEGLLKSKIGSFFKQEVLKV
ncbi:MAG: DNA repair helicase [Candidatus Odinarchaeum yellowstonii]|uniref:DNA 5'-3' helicase n=1 Tax=Odinarchaeota yellowstonii (strain LCB_4) TaxID=1841599 RepID=A0AAF0D3I2_ODILC|nr:MAG: DNA repair helicase [Candidatus Odinarchaeum yellowstonii]